MRALCDARDFWQNNLDDSTNLPYRPARPLHQRCGTMRRVIVTHCGPVGTQYHASCPLAAQSAADRWAVATSPVPACDDNPCTYRAVNRNRTNVVAVGQVEI